MKNVSPDNTPQLFNFFEECMIATVFSFLVLEVFCNSVIVSEVSEPYVLKRKNDDVTVDPKDLARVTSIEEKLANILPDILGVDSPKGKKEWEEFKRLKKARDDVVHWKNEDVNFAEEDMMEKGMPLFSSFFQENLPLIPKFALDLIENLGPPAPGSQWFKHAKARASADD